MADLMILVRAIIAGDVPWAMRLLSVDPELARASASGGASRERASEHFLKEIAHYIYTGDTALHIAAAAHQPEMISALVAQGADVGARNRRGAQPLHYAADGVPGTDRWNPSAQAATVEGLIAAGADPNAVDASGVAPLHRAVRTRCAAAVHTLLRHGADPRQKNKSGSTPFDLAIKNTGRGGSGSEASKEQQAQIIALLQRYGRAP